MEKGFMFPSELEDNLYLLDLESLEGGFSDILIIDEFGDVVLCLPLDDLPGNSIYELDLSGIRKGEYTVRVRTFRQEQASHVSIR